MNFAALVGLFLLFAVGIFAIAYRIRQENKAVRVKKAFDHYLQYVRSLPEKRWTKK